jgi:hypothetical protein
VLALRFLPYLPPEQMLTLLEKGEQQQQHQWQWQQLQQQHWQQQQRPGAIAASIRYGNSSSSTISSFFNGSTS